MKDAEARAAFEVECAERHHEAMKAFRNKKSRELRDAEHALDDAYVSLVAKREELALIKASVITFEDR